MTKHLVQVSEWRPLLLPPEHDSPAVRQRILRAGETAIGSAFRMSRNRLYARDLVGLVDVGPIQVQVVPKLYDDSSVDDDCALLLHHLARSAMLKRAAVLRSSSKISKLPVTEPIFRHVADELHRLLLQGAPRRYHPVDEVASTIRGRIDLGRVAKRRPGTEHLVPIRYAPLHLDNALARLLRALADRIAGLTRVAKTRSILLRCSDTLHDALRVPLSPELADAVQPTRLETDWEPLVRFARLLARGTTNDIARAGGTGGFGLLFPLDGLFESLLRAVVRRALSDASGMRLRASKAAGRLFRRPSDGVEAFTLKPDIVVERTPSNQIAVVGDAKWKRLDLSKASLGVAPADVYQLLSYMGRTEADAGVLFFPRADRLGPPLRLHAFEALPDGRRMTVVELSVEALLSRDVGARKQIDDALRALFAGLSPVKNS